jgi:FkbM family methyltransferase
MTFRRVAKKLLIGMGLLRPALIVARNSIQRDKKSEHRARVQFFSRFVRPGDLCFDLGCNVGHMSEALLDIGARVVAVDPQADCIREAHARVGHKKRIEFVCTAGGASQGTAKLFIAPSSVVSSLRSGWFEEHVATVEVPVTTLDLLIAQYGTPHYIKIDVEGFELEVLKGLTHKVNCISFEYHTSHRLESIDGVLECLRRIRSLQGRCVANVNLNNEPEYVFPVWQNLEEFTEVSIKDLWSRPRSFGDIVVLAADCAASLGLVPRMAH